MHTTTTEKARLLAIGASLRRASLRGQSFARAAILALTACFAAPALAQETICAKVKIEIKQELTLERQAFDAEMKINNTTDTGVIENVGVVVKVTDENGTPVSSSDDPNDLNAKFFIRVSNRQNISNVDGQGTVSPKTTSTINWLIIPAPGSAGSSPLGKKYLVGATLKYRFGGEDTVLEVSPDVITVKPLPLLTLDYFLTQEVQADDPLTAEIEPVVPFTLGVRVRNNGMASAKNLKIDSAQPKIVENNQGLLINFTLTGSYVDDAPTQNSLLINFDEIAPGKSKMGRWNMETSLAGKFTEFTARFSHADELGGALTSLVQATNAHFLIRDVRVDLPGRDFVRDFLASDGDVIRLYESDGADTEVTDRSTVATLTTSGASSAGNARYQLSFPPTSGFAYVKLADPFNGEKALGQIVRSDAKTLTSENVWLSKTRNEQTKKYEHWVNFFDVNSTGEYATEFNAPPPAARAPVIQFIPDRTVVEEQQVSYLVQASSPDGKPLVLSAAPLPTGARFTQQAADPANPGPDSAVLDWTPAKGQDGSYLIVVSASDGALSSSRSATIKVEAKRPPAGPGTPGIESPQVGVQVTTLRPTLSVRTPSSALDPMTQVQFELYSDEAETLLVASALVDRVKAGAAGGDAPPTSWQVPDDLDDNRPYWWRARGFDGSLYSPWVNARFFVNTFNDPPDNFNLTVPVPNAEVTSLTPELSWTNSSDKEGDALSYKVFVYSDEDLSAPITQSPELAPDAGGTTSWLVSPPLTNHARYFWQVAASDALGAQTVTPARPFVVNTGNVAPTEPTLLSPAVGGQSRNSSTPLVIQNSVDADNDLVTYVFQIDTANTFDTEDKRSSDQIIAGSGGTTQWLVTALAENRRYWWRVKAQDGRAESPWVVGDFLMNASNEVPPAPTVANPGNGAWIATQQPTLEANPVDDPENEAVRYEFEVYRDADLSQKVTEGTSTNTAFIVPVLLQDKTTHYWRVRAVDEQLAASPWSAVAVLYVSTGPYQDPSIAVTAPSTAESASIGTAADGSSDKRYTIRWEGTGPNIEATVALYYDSDNTGFDGTLIADGLRHGSGTRAGQYDWNVSSLAPAAYYVYAVIYDPKGFGRSYAPGAVVVPPTSQTGNIRVNAGRTLTTTEKGGIARFDIRLGNAPNSTVTVPLSSTDRSEGVVSPHSLIFTPQNWSATQQVTITGQDDCNSDGDVRYQVLSGKAQTLDPNYIGLSGAPVNIRNRDSKDVPNSTNNPNLGICGLIVISERKIDKTTWEYVLTAELGNDGLPVRGVTAKLTQHPTNVQLLENTLIFGAIDSGEKGKTTDTVTFRSRSKISSGAFKKGKDFKWTVTTQQ